MRRVTAARLAALLLAAVLVGCTGGAAQRSQATLDTLKLVLPGEYSSASQADAVGVHLEIRSVIALAVGDPVLYVRATAADDPRRVLWQRVWTLALVDDRVVQLAYGLKEPRRWQGVPDEPKLLEALLPDDLAELSGCSLTWTPSPGGYTAAQPGACRPDDAMQGQWIEQKITLQGGDLTLLEQQVGADAGTPGWSLTLHRGGARKPTTDFGSTAAH